MLKARVHLASGALMQPDVLLLSGTVESDPVSFCMYYDASGSFTGVANSLTVFTYFPPVGQ